MGARHQTYHLSIWEIIPKLHATLIEKTSCILIAPPGSGKSTIVPLTLIDTPWRSDKKIAVLEPRRIAARNIAERISILLDDSVGGKVGLRMRDETITSSHSIIEVMTEGTFLRVIQSDPALTDYAAVVLDEFHERSLSSDIAFTFLYESQEAALCKDLRIIIMSATLDPSSITKMLRANNHQEFPVITCEGKSPYPVKIYYHHINSDGKDAFDYRLPKEKIGKTVAKGIHYALAKNWDGDILAFLPGRREINECHHLLHSNPFSKDFEIYPFHGSMSLSDQRRVIIRQNSQNIRRIILATSIAETSLTIEGINIVVDSGYTRTLAYDATTGISRYETRRISKDSAEQRAGRAGRIGPGIALRLWSVQEEEAFQPLRTPEIITADLSSLLLESLLWGAKDILALPWLTPPPLSLLASAKTLLIKLGAISKDGSITAYGKNIATLGMHPRIAAMIEKARPDETKMIGASALASLLEDGNYRHDTDDLLCLVATILNKINDKTPHIITKGFLKQCQRLKVVITPNKLSEEFKTNILKSIPTLIATAYPERLARRRITSSNHNSTPRYLTIDGQGVKLQKGSNLVNHEWLAIATLVFNTDADATIVSAAPYPEVMDDKNIEKSIETIPEIQFDIRSAKLSAKQVKKLGVIILNKSPLSLAECDHNLAKLALFTVKEVLSSNGFSVLPKIEIIRNFLLRVACARLWLPELNIPELTEAILIDRVEDWLFPYLYPVSIWKELSDEAVEATLSLLIPSHLFSQICPTHINIGIKKRNIPIKYSLSAPPSFEIIIQEIMGTISLPKIAYNKVPLSVTLLSPARRPLQTTSDLENFWQGSYQQIRKEMKGRYPRHFWPERPQDFCT